MNDEIINCSTSELVSLNARMRMRERQNWKLILFLSLSLFFGCCCCWAELLCFALLCSSRSEANMFAAAAAAILFRFIINQSIRKFHFLWDSWRRWRRWRRRRWERRQWNIFNDSISWAMKKRKEIFVLNWHFLASNKILVSVFLLLLLLLLVQRTNKRIEQCKERTNERTRSESKMKSHLFVCLT